jgi:glutaryl-CoA dehydrogenase
LQPSVLEALRDETTDPSIFRELGEIGPLGPTIPEVHGGAGLNYVSYGLIAREVEHVDPGYRTMMSVQSSLAMVSINAFGNEATKQTSYPNLRRARGLAALASLNPTTDAI